MEFRRNKKLLLAMTTVLWLTLVGVGFIKILHYEYRPGQEDAAPQKWPADSGVPQAHNLATLVVVAHPHCPCTRATIGELAMIMTRCQGRLHADVLFYKPLGFTVNWERTDLWRSAAAIPGVSVMVDEGGVEANRFRASTSGEVRLYDARGTLLFAGGITDGRGHSGDNDGRDAIVSLVSYGRANRVTTPVFGCSIVEGKPTDQKETQKCHRPAATRHS
jgi:hypothetical protein